METANSLRSTNKRVRNVTDGEKRLKDKINLIENEVKQLKETLNAEIKRMNDYHQWVDMIMGMVMDKNTPEEDGEIVELRSIRPPTLAEEDGETETVSIVTEQEIPPSVRTFHGHMPVIPEEDGEIVVLK